MAADWSVLSIEGVDTAVKQVSARIGDNLPDFTEADDIMQQAYLWCALNPEQVRQYVDENGTFNKSHFSNRLYSRMLNELQPELRRQQRLIPLTRLVESGV